MKKKTDFQMTRDTKRIAPFWEKGTGELHSEVLEGNHILHLPVPPYEIIDFNLRRVGSSLRGAKDSAKQVIGSTSMFPVALGRNMEWIWFMSEAMKNEHCHWYGLHHVKDMEEIDDKRTEILLYCGHKDVLPVPKNPLMNRKENAHLYQSKLWQNTYPHPFLYDQPYERFGQVSEGERPPYKVNKPDKDEEDK